MHPAVRVHNLNATCISALSQTTNLRKLDLASRQTSHPIRVSCQLPNRHPLSLHATPADRANDGFRMQEAAFKCIIPRVHSRSSPTNACNPMTGVYHQLPSHTNPRPPCGVGADLHPPSDGCGSAFIQATASADVRLARKDDNENNTLCNT
jgi:hypothetical protein